MRIVPLLTIFCIIILNINPVLGIEYMKKEKSLSFTITEEGASEYYNEVGELVNLYEGEVDGFINPANNETFLSIYVSNLNTTKPIQYNIGRVSTTDQGDTTYSCYDYLLSNTINQNGYYNHTLLWRIVCSGNQRFPLKLLISFWMGDIGTFTANIDIQLVFYVEKANDSSSGFENSVSIFALLCVSIITIRRRNG